MLLYLPGFGKILGNNGGVLRVGIGDSRGNRGGSGGFKRRFGRGMAFDNK
jgi:hypothetical protein